MSSGQPTNSPLTKAVKRKAQDVLHVLLHSEVRVTLDVWNFVLAALLAAQKKAGVKRFQANLLANPAKVEQGLSQGHLLSHTHTLTLSLSLPPSLPPSLPHSLTPSLSPSLPPSLPPSLSLSLSVSVFLSLSLSVFLSLSLSLMPHPLSRPLSLCMCFCPISLRFTLKGGLFPGMPNISSCVKPNKIHRPEIVQCIETFFNAGVSYPGIDMALDLQLRGYRVILGHSIHSCYTKNPAGKWVTQYVQGDHLQIVLSDTVVAEAQQRQSEKNRQQRQQPARSRQPPPVTMRKFCVG